MKRILAQSFFNRPSSSVAKDLLGKYLVRRKNGVECAYLITETESYGGYGDTTSHAARGKTAGNAPMFGKAGIFYVYLCYGMYWMLNVVTGAKGYPAAVLIRGVEGTEGPGRLTKKIAIDKKFNNKMASSKTGLWFEERGIVVTERTIKKTPRIGVGGTKEWVRKPLRFVLQRNEKIKT